MTSWNERLRLILAIVDKDRRIPLWIWLMMILVAGVVFVYTLSVASNIAASPYRFAWKWYDSSLRPLYAVSAVLTSLTLGLTFSHFYHGEVQRGTIRSIVLYPVDMNDITIAKLLSTLIVAGLLSTILWLGIFGGFFVAGLYPVGDFLAIQGTALVMSFLALAAGVFLAQGLAHVTGRMAISPTALGALFLFLSLIFTETSLTGIGVQIAALRHPGVPISFAEYESIANAARSLSVLSPQHVGARILGIAFGLTGMWSDIHVVLPLGALAIAGGYWLGKKVYLDIFVR
jgi:ABC-type transport system involved in multi-copper enzyme maturation permease subunit